MKKRFISLIVAFTAAFNVSALSVSADENEAIEVVKFDNLTKTSETYAVDMDSLIESNEAMLEELELSETETTEANLPIESENVSVGSGSVQSIFPPASLTRVNPNNSPYSAVLQIKSGWDTNNDGTVDIWTYGTGFLEGNDVMVTSASNLYHTSYGHVTDCRIYSKHNSPYFGDDFYHPKSWLFSTAYTSNSDPNYDWCLVTLFDNLGGSNGWFGISIGPDASNINSNVTISGYPNTASKIGYQYKASGNIDSSTTSLYYYTIATEIGQGGAPIYDPNYNVIGINTGSTNTSNYGVRINNYLYNQILNMYLEGVNRWN